MSNTVDQCSSNRFTLKDTVVRIYVCVCVFSLPFIFWILLQTSQLDTFTERDKRQLKEKNHNLHSHNVTTCKMAPISYLSLVPWWGRRNCELLFMMFNKEHYVKRSGLPYLLLTATREGCWLEAELPTFFPTFWFIFSQEENVCLSNEELVLLSAINSFSSVSLRPFSAGNITAVLASIA